MISETWRQRAEVVNLWTETIGIIAAGLFGYYQFIYKEVRVPRSAPVNVTLEVALERLTPLRVGDSVGGQLLIPIQIKVVARNPSTREVALLPSMVVVYGDSLSVQDVSFTSRTAASSFDSISGAIHERYVTRVGREAVAFGNPLVDDSIKPGETLSRTFITYVTPNRYHRVEAVVAIPSAIDATNLVMRYHIDPINQSVVTELFEMRKGKLTPAKQSPNGDYLVGDRELQESFARCQLSLAM
jgi:hypothetical protein